MALSREDLNLTLQNDGTGKSFDGKLFENEVSGTGGSELIAPYFEDNYEANSRFLEEVGMTYDGQVERETQQFKEARQRHKDMARYRLGDIITVPWVEVAIQGINLNNPTNHFRPSMVAATIIDFRVQSIYDGLCPVLRGSQRLDSGNPYGSTIVGNESRTQGTIDPDAIRNVLGQTGDDGSNNTGILHDGLGTGAFTTVESNQLDGSRNTPLPGPSSDFRQKNLSFDASRVIPTGNYNTPATYPTEQYIPVGYSWMDKTGFTAQDIQTWFSNPINWLVTINTTSSDFINYEKTDIDATWIKILTKVYEIRDEYGL